MLEILLENIDVVRTVHILGVALGVGTATITDLFFFKFLKDFKISSLESGVMNTLSGVIWFALVILVVSGTLLYLEDVEKFNNSSKFLTKMIIVGVIIVNGITLNFFVSPRLAKITFHKKHEHQPGELHHIRKIAFALGAVSVTSWYSAFILGMFRSVPLSFSVLLSAYITLLVVVIAFSQLAERVYSKKAREVE